MEYNIKYYWKNMLKLNYVSNIKFLIKNIMVEDGVERYELYFNKNEYHIV